MPATASSTRRSFWYASVLYSHTAPGSWATVSRRSSSPLVIVSRWRTVILASSLGLALVQPGPMWPVTGSSSVSKPWSRARPINVEMTLFCAEAMSCAVSASAPFQYCSATMRPSDSNTNVLLLAAPTISSNAARPLSV